MNFIGIEKDLLSKNGKSCGQETVVNSYIWLAVPISQDIICKKMI